MTLSEIYHIDVIYNDAENNLQKAIDFKQKMLKIMAKQYFAGEDMEISTDTLTRWRELIHLEEVELESYLKRLDKLSLFKAQGSSNRIQHINQYGSIKY